MMLLDREQLFRRAEGIYQERFKRVIPSNIELITAVDLILPACVTRQGKAELLGSIAEKKALLQSLEEKSPVSQETLDVCDAVVEAVQRLLAEAN